MCVFFFLVVLVTQSGTQRWLGIRGKARLARAALQEEQAADHAWQLKLQEEACGEIGDGRNGGLGVCN